VLSRCGHSSRSANRLEERFATTTICGKLESCVDRVAFIFYCPVMSKKSTVAPSSAADESKVGTSRHKPSSLLDTRVIYCGDNLEQIPKLPPASIDYMRPRCVELARVLKKTGSFYYHCDWHASHYVKVMLDQIFGENNFSK